MKDYIYQFKDYLSSEKNLSENTIYSYYNDIEQFENFVINEKHIKNIDNLISIELLDDFIIYLNINDISSRSIARKLSSLSLFLKFLKIEGYINDNPIYLVNRPKIGKHLPNYLEINEIEALINSFDIKKPEGIRDRTLFELMYSCGLRVSEISNLDISSIYFKERLLQVFGKGNKERYVPIGTRAINELKVYLSDTRPHLLKPNKKTMALFLNYRGERLSRKGIWKNLKIHAKLSGIDKEFGVHTIRHSFATHLIKNGADIRGVQSLLGHKNITTTEIYTHLDTDYLKEVYKKFHSHR